MSVQNETQQKYILLKDDQHYIYISSKDVSLGQTYEVFSLVKDREHLQDLIHQVSNDRYFM